MPKFSRMPHSGLCHLWGWSWCSAVWYRLQKQMRQLLMLWWWKCEGDNVDEYNEEESVANSKCPPSMNHSSCPNCLFNYTPLSSACGQFFLLFNVINKNCQRHNGPRLLCIGCKFGHWDCPIGVRDFHPQILLTTTMSGWPIDRSRMICHLISNFREGWGSFARWIRTCGGCRAAGREKKELSQMWDKKSATSGPGWGSRQTFCT